MVPCVSLHKLCSWSKRRTFPDRGVPFFRQGCMVAALPSQASRQALGVCVEERSLCTVVKLPRLQTHPNEVLHVAVCLFLGDKESVILGLFPLTPNPVQFVALCPECEEISFNSALNAYGEELKPQSDCHFPSRNIS